MSTSHAHQIPLFAGAGTLPSIADIDRLHAATAIYTQSTVVEDILDRLEWPRGGETLIEPSCGDGQFLVAAIARLLAQPSGTVLASDVPARVQAWEIHLDAVRQARQRIVQLLVSHGADTLDANAIARATVHHGDFLTDAPPGAFAHVILGNPPYLRAVNLPNAFRDRYALTLPKHACPDLLYAFLDACAQRLHPGGRIALVTADRWLFNEGASALRAALGQRLALHAVHRLDVSSAFYRPKNRRAGSLPRVHPVVVVLGDATHQRPAMTGEAIYPGAAVGVAGKTLGDVALVSLAPWLGTGGIFVVDAATAAQFAPDDVVPAVDTKDIVQGVLQPPKRYAIRTVADVTPSPAIAAHLSAQLDRMAPRGRRTPWWLPPETWHKLALDQPALLVPRIARRLTAVRLPAGTLPINHNLHIVVGRGADLDMIAAALAHPDSDDWFKQNAAPLESGFYSVTTRLLRRMPLPST